LYWLIAGALLAFFTLWGLHNTKWNIITGNELEPPWTYVWGLAPLLGIYTGWLALEKPAWQLAALGIWAIIGSGGFAVLVAYYLEEHPSPQLLETSVGRDGRTRKRHDARTD
jgi:hypothetical protein